MPMETHAAVAEWDPLDGPTLWTSTQQPHVVRNVAAQVFGLPQSKVRVRKPFVGGAFGHKEGLHTHEAMALLGARRLGRPVRFVLTRTEEFTATVSRNPQVRDVEIALRDDGTVLGWRERIVQDVGAYSGLGPSVLALSQWVTVGPYRTPALDEVMLDIAARALGTDPFELRRRNLIRQRDLPTRTANGLKLDTLPIEEAMTVAAEAIDLDGLRARLGPFQGIGIANMIEWGGGCRWLDDWDADIGSVTVTLQPDGSAVVASDAADSGQGHATLFTQITADLLGVEPATVAAMVHEDRKSLPPGMEAGALVATASYDTPSEVPDANGYGNFAANYTCSATIAVVEVDPATGKIRVLDWSSAEDAGRTLHPDLLKGQIQGGIAQGIGYALGEDLLFDSSGTMLNPSMVDYQVPTAPEVPPSPSPPRRSWRRSTGLGECNRLHSKCKPDAMIWKQGGGETMGSRTIGFAVADEDRAELDELVEYFGHGNRSAYLRATIRVMKSVKLAEELRDLQAYGQGKLAEHGLTLDDIPRLTRQILKGQE
jgi:carbon-monoxide dehydrogenase large subunit